MQKKNHVKWFIPEISPTTYPFSYLTKQNVEFVWTFQVIKNCLTDFQQTSTKRNKLCVFWPGRNLIDPTPKFKKWARVICYTFQSLTDTEQRENV